MAKDENKDKNLNEAPKSGETIVNQDIVGQMKKSYIDYAMSVITSRALPVVRDGIKPVHR